MLIELDPTMSEAELGHLKSDLVAAQLDVARLRAALAQDANPIEQFQPPEGASQTLIEMHRQFLLSQSAEQNAKLAEIRRQHAQNDAERATITATIAARRLVMRRRSRRCPMFRRVPPRPQRPRLASSA